MNSSKLKLCRAAFGVAALFGLFLLAGVGQAATYYYNGVQNAGENWNQSIWTNVAGATKLPPAAGNNYVVLTGGGPSRLRNPTTAGIVGFLGDSLQFNTGSELRAKTGSTTGLYLPGVNGNPGLIMNGGNLDIGDDNFNPNISGYMMITANSTMSCGDAAQLGRGWIISAKLAGTNNLTISKRVQPRVASTNAMEVTGANNPFSGQWTIVGGAFKATGLNSLGTNSITLTTNYSVGAAGELAGSTFEPMYDLASSGKLTLISTCQVILHQNCSFAAGVSVGGSNLPAGIYPYATLVAAFPKNFTGSSGQITAGTPPVITVQMTNLTVLAGSPATFTAVASSLGPITFAWYTNGPATNVVVDPNATTNYLAGTNYIFVATNAYTLPAVTLDDNGKTFQVVVSNVLGTSTSLVANLTVVTPDVHIYQAPVNLVGNENSNVTFTVGGIGAGTLYYQWYSNGVAIVNETNSFYTTPTLKPIPFNTVAYTVSVSNNYPSIVTSTPVYVTVTPESIPPHLTTAIARGGPATAIAVWFDEPVVPNPANYSIPGVAVLGAASGQNSNSVVLTTAPLVPGHIYPLTISGVLDQDAQTPNPSVAITTNLVYQGTFSPGFALAEVYNNIGAGTTIADLTNSIKYLQGQPDVTSYLTNVYFSNGGATNYGAKVSGYFTAPVSGAYGFYLIHDDPGQFRMSSDDNPANLNQAAPLINQGCCNAGYADGANAATNTLVGGQRYYFELLMKQGAGGEYVGLAVRFPGDATATASLPSFFSPSYLGSYANSNGVSIAFTVQPPDLFTYQNQMATLTAVVSFTPTGPVEYQWQVDDGLYNFANISGAAGLMYPTNQTGTAVSFISYTTPILAAQTNHYQLLVSIPGSGAVVSRVATLYAATDVNPPQLASVAQDNTPANTAPSLVRVTYSEPVDVASATTPANYKINGVAGSVLSVVPIATNSVQLVTTGLIIGATNSLFVTSVGDTAGNLMTDSTVSFRCYAVVSNGMARGEWFTNMGSAGNVSWVNTLLAFPNFTNNQPDLVLYTNTLNYNGNNGNNGIASNYYGQFWTGYLTPTVSGNYSFWVQSDDEGRFLLSTDESPANLQLLVRYADGACCGTGIYESGTVSLQAGKSYFYEGLMKQGTGGDYFRVQWLVPGNGAYSTIPSSCLSYKVWPQNVVTITSMSGNQTVQENKPLTLAITTTASSEPGLSYQWLSNGLPVLGGTNTTFSIPFAATNLNGVAFRCAVTGRAVNTTNYYGGTYTNTQISTPAVITVTPDYAAPTVVSVVGDTTLTNIIVSFSKPLDPASALNLANYAISPTLAIKSVVYVAGSTNVILTTAPQTMDRGYTVTFNGLTDTAASRNPIAANTAVPFTAWILQAGYLRVDVFTNNTGTLDTLTNSVPYLNNTPDFVNYITQFWNYEDNADGTEMANYSARISGYFIAPSNGLYRFYIHSDDASRLYMNTNGMDPAGKVLLAQETGCCHMYDPTNGNATSVSTNISLTNGQYYYIEALLHQGGGGQWVQVAFREKSDTSVPTSTTGAANGRPALPNTVVLPIGTGTNEVADGKFFARWYNPDLLPFGFVRQAQATNLFGGQPAAFSVLATNAAFYPTNYATGTIFYQWQSNGVNIAGATGSNYTSAPLSGAADNTTYSCVVSSPGHVVASSALVRVLTPPPVVTAVGAVSSITVSWSGASAATNYLVNRATTSGGPYTPMGSITGSTFVDSPLAAGFAGYYVITAQGAAGSTNSVEVTAATIPSAPVLRASSSDSTVTLGWTPIPGAAEYFLLVSSTPGGPYTLLAATAVNSFVHAPLVNWTTTNYYVVYATNVVGVGPYSNEAMGTPRPGPVGLVAVGGLAQAALSWTPFPNATTYTVKRSATHGGPYAVVQSGVAGTNTVDSPLTAGLFYYYVVSAHVTGGQESGDSAEASALTTPGAPMGLTATLAGATTVNLNWSSANDPSATTFKVERSTDGVTFVPIASGVNGTSYTDTNPIVMVTFYYRVRASNATGDSPPSNVARVTTGSFVANVNFGLLSPTDFYPGYVQDSGYVYGDRSNGFFYGWTKDVTADARERSSTLSADKRYDTLIHFMKATPYAGWSIAVPNGAYNVHFASGDATAYDMLFQFQVNGLLTGTYDLNATGNPLGHWVEFSNLLVSVTGGQLTVTNGPAASNNKICYIDIQSVPPPPLQIVAQPQSTNIIELQTAVFTVAASGTAPLAYQWYYNGSALPGQTGSTLTLTDVPLTAAGPYWVVVTDPFGITATSSNALLSVAVDNVQPTLLGAAGHFTYTLATVTFSERVTDASATNLVNYQINDGNGDVLPIYNAVLQPNRATVLLTTARQIPGMVYTVTVSDVADISSHHNVIPIYSAVSFTGWVESPGYLYVQRFDNIPGVSVSNLTSTAQFMTEAADWTGFATNFSFTTGGLVNYGARVSGYFIPPSNGVYRFYIRSDDASQLFLNPNGPEATGKMWIASEEGCCDAYDPTVGRGTPLTFNTNSVSAGFPLTNGMRYYMEALLKQGTGGEYVQVAFREAGDYSVPVSPNSSTTVGAEVAGSQFFSTPANPDLIGATITQQPQDVTVEENRTAVFRFGATITPTNLQTMARYQWYKDGVMIAGANTATLTGPEVVLVGNQYLPMAPLYDDGTSYQCILTGPGLSVTSSAAMLHVWPDYEGPNIVSVGSLDGRQIGVVFDEVVDPLSATDPGNWTINNYQVGVVGSPVLRPDGKTVLLTLDTQVSSGYAVEALVYDIASDGGNFGDSFANGVVLMPASGHQDIGIAPGLADPLYPGSVFVGSTNNLIEVYAGGTDIWNTNDGLHYIYVPLAGDFTAQVQVRSLTAANLWTKAGLMLRETLDPNSRELAILATPATADGGTNVFQVIVRSASNTGAAAGAYTAPNVYSYPNAWLRLARRGTNFFTYYGTNGVDWIMLYSNAPSPAYGDTAYVGLGTTAHNNSATNYTIADFAGFQLLAPPIITRQPEPASVMVPVYGQTRFTNLVVDSSSAVTYQWRKNGVPIVAAVNPYATNASLRLFNLLPADAGNYTVAIMNENGTTISLPCVVSISNAPPVVVAETNSVLQNVVLHIPASDLLRNDSDPEGGTLSVSALGGLSTRVFSTDFQTGVPANSAIYGSAAVVAAGANQYLQLTPASGLQYGSWIINELTPGVAVNSFSVLFKVRIADTSQVPESGFSLNFATDLVDAAAPAFPSLAEYGVGSGLSVCVKTYDYNGANTAGIMVKWNGTTVGGVQIPQWLNTNWVAMQVDLGQNGKVNVMLDGTNVFSSLPTPYAAFTGGRFGFYARTGGQWETHSLDDLSVYIPSVSDSNRTATALGGTAVLSNNVVTYTPATGVCGWDSFNYVVSDGMGGLSAATKWVRISPANPQPPFFVFCPTFSVPLTPTNCQTVVQDYTSALVVTDSCCCVTLVQNPPAGAAVGAGIHTIVFTATDAVGLSSSCATTLTVEETLPPGFVSCPSAMTVPNDSGQCGAVVHYTNPVGVDAWICPGVASPVTVQIAGLPSGAVYPVGKTTNTFRATSAVGISSLCRFVVTVTDSENPHITCPPAETLTADAGGMAALPNLIPATVATDNCGTPSLQQAPAAGTPVPVGITNVVITARDGAGNINTCTVVVTVQSGVKPEPAIAVLDTGEVKVYWPATATGWNLYSTPELKDTGTVWTKVSSSLYQTNNGVIYILVTNPAGKPNTFYRLKNP